MSFTQEHMFWISDSLPMLRLCYHSVAVNQMMMILIAASIQLIWNAYWRSHRKCFKIHYEKSEELFNVEVFHSIRKPVLWFYWPLVSTILKESGRMDIQLERFNSHDLQIQFSNIKFFISKNEQKKSSVRQEKRRKHEVKTGV